jgi:hypothetical protein
MTLSDYLGKVVLGDITVRGGLQYEEKFIPTKAKPWIQALNSYGEKIIGENRIKRR